MTTQHDALLSVAHVAERLDRHRDTVYEMIRRGDLRVVLQLGHYRVKESELSRYINSLESGKRTARVAG